MNTNMGARDGAGGTSAPQRLRRTLTAAVAVVFLAALSGLLDGLPSAVADLAVTMATLAVVLLALLNTPAAARATLAASVVGTVSETSTPDGHKVRDVDQRLTLKAPQANPLNTILRRIRKTKKATAEKVEWETDEVLPRTTITTAATAAGAANVAKVLPVENAGYYRQDDLLLLTENTLAENGLLYVQSIDAGNGTITVQRWDGGTGTTYGSVPAVASGEKLVRMGNLKEEGYGFSAPRTTMPVSEHNLIEEVDATIEITDRRANTKNYTVDDWQRSRDRQLYDFLSNQEFKLIYGKREKKQVVKDGRLVNITSMGGISQYNIAKQLTYSAASLSEKDIIEWHRVLFTGNTGGQVRYAFCDTQFAADMAGVPLDRVRHKDFESKTLQFGVVETRMLGMGTIRWIPSQMFTVAGKSRVAWIFDIMCIDFVPFMAMNTTTRGKKQTGKTVREVNIAEAYSTRWRYPDTHMLIEGSP